MPFLDGLGITEAKHGNRAEIRIPYLGPTGELIATRIRMSLTGDARFRWAKGSKTHPYGLWRLREAVAKRSIVVVEGESDAQTCWYHDIPAIGIPGATIWKQEWIEYLKAIPRIYVVQEPDQAAEQLVRHLAGAFSHDRLHVIRLESAKDVSELYLQNPKGFVEAFQTAVERARAYQDLAADEATHRQRTLEPLCGDLLEKEDILSALVEDLARGGLVGEDRATKLLYLVLTSRLLPRPMSAIVRAASSSGKSFIVEHVLRRAPASAFMAMTSMSEKALTYDQESLKHRVLVFYEHAGMRSEFLDYCVRSLLSEGRLSYISVEKTKDGTMKTRRIEREGPTGLILTTTRRIEPELATRMLPVSINESSVQTKRVIDALAKASQLGDTPSAHDTGAWVALQEYLAAKPARVVIPFAPVLANLVQPTVLRLRRDFSQVLSLIESHALLHQRRRSRDARGRVVATLRDYASVIESGSPQHRAGDTGLSQGGDKRNRCRSPSAVACRPAGSVIAYRGQARRRAINRLSAGQQMRHLWLPPPKRPKGGRATPRAAWEAAARPR